MDMLSPYICTFVQRFSRHYDIALFILFNNMMRRYYSHLLLLSSEYGRRIHEKSTVFMDFHESFVHNTTK